MANSDLDSKADVREPLLDELAAGREAHAVAPAASSSSSRPSPPPTPAGSDATPPVATLLILVVFGGLYVSLARVLGFRLHEPWPNVLLFVTASFVLYAAKPPALDWLCARQGLSRRQTSNVRWTADNAHAAFSLVGFASVLYGTGERELTDAEFGVSLGLAPFVTVGFFIYLSLRACLCPRVQPRVVQTLTRQSLLVRIGLQCTLIHRLTSRPPPRKALLLLLPTTRPSRPRWPSRPPPRRRLPQESLDPPHQPAGLVHTPSRSPVHTLYLPYPSNPPIGRPPDGALARVATAGAAQLVARHLLCYLPTPHPRSRATLTALVRAL